MSGLNDFIDGQQVQHRLQRGAAQRSAVKISDWMNYAKELELKLAQANLTIVAEQAHGRASIELARELRQHIAKVNPSDPLGKAEVINPRLMERKKQLVEERGYRVVDPATFRIAPR